jgi:hypothetical protein
MGKRKKAKFVWQRSLEDWEATKFAILLAVIVGIVTGVLFTPVIGFGLFAIFCLVSIVVIMFEEIFEKDLFPKKKYKQFSKK